MKNRMMKRLAAISGIMALPLLLAIAEAALIGQPTSLRNGPFSDAESLAELASGTQVEILQRQGGWYEIKSGEQQGWVRMSSVQLGSGGDSSAGLGDTLGFLQSGRASSTEATPSTGVRGLDESQLARAQPDLDAVARLDRFAAQEPDARQFAGEIPLKTTSVQDLPKEAR